jgi:hypothetical protein
MKTLLLLLTLAAPLSAQLIDTAKPAPSKAQLAADSIVDAINAEITHRVAVHKTAWETLWRNEREGATPEAILGAMGTKAALVKAQQLRDDGWSDVRALNLMLGAGEDLADFCRLHGAESATRLPLCADVAVPSSAAPAQRTQSQAIIDQLATLGYL